MARLREERAVKEVYSNRQTPKWAVENTETPSGVVVDHNSAIRHTTVFQCIRVVSEDLASLPLHVYRPLKPRGKEKATDHPVYDLLHRQPNREMTSMVFREALQTHVLLTGNGYAWIERDRAMMPVALWPLRADLTRPERIDGELFYFARLENSTREEKFKAFEVLHVPGLGWDGIKGFDPITLMRNSLGLAIAAEEFGGRYFGGGAHPGGVLEMEKSLSKPAYERLKEEWKSTYSGIKSAHKVAILEQGLKWRAVGMSPEQSQFLDTRKFQRNDIAAWYRVKPHKINDLDRATFSNIEHQSIESVQDTTRPWCIRWEQEFDRKLLITATDPPGTYFTKHNVEGLLRGDSKARNEAYAIGRQWGWYSANDILELEDRNPLPGKLGDIYLVPLNMIPVDQVGLDPGDGSQSSAGLKARHIYESRLETVYGRLYIDYFRRSAQRETNGLRRVLKGAENLTIEEIDERLAEFCETHGAFMRRHLFPIVETLAGQIDKDLKVKSDPDLVAEVVAEAVAQYLNVSRGSILSAIEAAESPADRERILAQLLDDFLVDRAPNSANESCRAAISVLYEGAIKRIAVETED